MKILVEFSHKGLKSISKILKFIILFISFLFGSLNMFWIIFKDIIMYEFFYDMLINFYSEILIILIFLLFKKIKSVVERSGVLNVVLFKKNSSQHMFKYAI